MVAPDGVGKVLIVGDDVNAANGSNRGQWIGGGDRGLLAQRMQPRITRPTSDGNIQVLHSNEDCWQTSKGLIHYKLMQQNIYTMYIKHSN